MSSSVVSSRSPEVTAARATSARPGLPDRSGRLGCGCGSGTVPFPPALRFCSSASQGVRSAMLCSAVGQRHTPWALPCSGFELCPARSICYSLSAMSTFARCIVAAAVSEAQLSRAEVSKGHCRVNRFLMSQALFDLRTPAAPHHRDVLC